jgi:TolB-like protein
VSDGTHLWSENYDREMNDIFKVQGEIARAVGKGITGKAARQ